MGTIVNIALNILGFFLLSVLLKSFGIHNEFNTMQLIIYLLIGIVFNLSGILKVLLDE